MVGGGGARQLPRVLPLAGQAEDQLPTVGDGEWRTYQLSELVSGVTTNCQSCSEWTAHSLTSLGLGLG